MSASPVFSVPCLPLFASLHASPFICLPSCVSLSGGVRLSGLVCALSPFICLPSCVSLSCGVRLSGLVCALSPFMCLPEWRCPPRRSCLCLVSLHSPSSELLGFFYQFLKVSALVLDGVSAFPRVLSPLVSPCSLVHLLVSVCWMVCPPSRGSCLPLSPFTFLFPFVGWRARLPKGLVSPCLPIVSLLASLCWMVRPPSRGSCLPLWPVVSLVSLCLPLCHLSPRWMVCPPSPESCLPLSPFLFPFLFPFVGWCQLPGSLVSPFLPLTTLLTLLVFLCWMVCPPSRGDKLTPLVSPCLPSWSPSGVLLGALNAFLRC